MAKVSRRLRYEVLRRDNYLCHYCGEGPPKVKLTVDAVIPEALGGTHKDPANLVTACEDCNGGKSSSSPDAPLVAAVAEDAARWAQAMRIAGEELLAKASEVTDAHAHFEQTWARYGSGPERRPLPKDPAWRQTITNLLAAGLPMGVLEECVEIAMGQRKVAEDGVFRYMCGIAWRRVRELRERAQGIVQGIPNPQQEGDKAEGLHFWCQIDRMSLRATLLDLMQALPGNVGIQRLREQEVWCREHARPDHNPDGPLVNATQWAIEDLALAQARQEMAFMPRDDYEQWVQRARDENADIAEHLTDAYFVIEAARMAREAPVSRVSNAVTHGVGNGGQ